MNRTARMLVRMPAPVALMAVIFWLSAQPDLETGLGIWDLVLRKLAHVTVYAALALLWWWALRPALERPLLPAATIALAYAISDELHQSFVAGRSGSPIDVAIDAVGIAVAAALVRYDHRLRVLDGEAP